MEDGLRSKSCTEKGAQYLLLSLQMLSKVNRMYVFLFLEYMWRRCGLMKVGSKMREHNHL